MAYTQLNQKIQTSNKKDHRWSRQVEAHPPFSLATGHMATTLIRDQLGNEWLCVHTTVVEKSNDRET